MNKVYVVTDGDYSDYHIVAVCSSREAAKKYLDGYEGKYIEEYTLDTEVSTVRTQIRFDKDKNYYYEFFGSIVDADKVDGVHDHGTCYDVIHSYPINKTQQDRIKIASELLFKALCEKTIITKGK